MTPNVEYSTAMSGPVAAEDLFCPITGALLEIDNANGVATCSLSGYQKDLSELEGYRAFTECNVDVRQCRVWLCKGPCLHKPH